MSALLASQSIVSHTTFRHCKSSASVFFAGRFLSLGSSARPQAVRAAAASSARSLFSMFNLFGNKPQQPVSMTSSSASSSIAEGPDTDSPGEGLQFAAFGAGCFWGVELAYQRVPGVVRTEVGYTHGAIDKPTYEAVCSGRTGHVEAVRVAYDPKEVSYEQLLEVLWKRHDPTTLNRQGNDRGTQYRSGIYFYTPEQEAIAKASIESTQAKLGRKVVTELLPAKKWYRAEEYHQQYLSKGGRMGFGQSAAKGCTDPIRCYG